MILGLEVLKVYMEQFNIFFGIRLGVIKRTFQDTIIKISYILIDICGIKWARHANVLILSAFGG